MPSFARNTVSVFPAAPCSALAYHHDSRRVFVGQDNGAVMVGRLQSALVLLTPLCSRLWTFLIKNSECLIVWHNKMFNSV